MKINIKFIPLCASCRFWDDPSRSAISPTIGKNVWEVDTTQKKFCIRKKISTKANAKCQQYESKLERY